MPRDISLGIAYLERTQETLINAHHRASVIKLSAIIWRTEKRYELSFGKKLVAIFDDLMCATDEVHIVLLQKARNDVRAKCKGYAAVVFTPPGNVLVRV